MLIWSNIWKRRATISTNSWQLQIKQSKSKIKHHSISQIKKCNQIWILKKNNKKNSNSLRICSCILKTERYIMNKYQVPMNMHYELYMQIHKMTFTKADMQAHTSRHFKWRGVTQAFTCFACSSCVWMSWRAFSSSKRSLVIRSCSWDLGRWR